MRFWPNLLLIFILISCHFLHTFGQAWQACPNFPGIARDDAAVFSFGNLHFCGTGRGLDFGCTKDFYCYNSQNNTWTSAPALPEWQDRQYATSFSFQGQGYLLGGENCYGTYLKTFWQFDLQTYTWHALPDFPGSGRAGAQHFLLDSTLYWIGGRNQTGILNEVWRFHFGNQQWEQLNNLPFEGIWRGIGFANHTSGFIACGRTNDQNQTGWNSETWQYNAANDQWTAITSQINLGTRMYVGTAQNDSLLFVFGGVNANDEVLNSLEKINLNNFQIETLLPFSSTSRKGCVAFCGNDYFFLSTGISGNDRLNETWKIAYSPEAEIKDEAYFEVQTSMQDASLLIQIPAAWIGEELQLMDLQGRIIHAYTLTAIKQQLSIANLPSGTYLVGVHGFTKKCLR